MGSTGCGHATRVRLNSADSNTPRFNIRNFPPAVLETFK
jgi:hypothetical protein